MGSGIWVLRLPFPLYPDTHLGSSYPACQHVWEKAVYVEKVRFSLTKDQQKKTKQGNQSEGPSRLPQPLGFDKAKGSQIST